MDIWNSYYKFIIVRNPWDRALSDYRWVMKDRYIKDSFTNFLKAKGKFKGVLTVKDRSYRGDHLKKQKEYFFLNGSQINYDSIIRFENTSAGFAEVINDLGLNKDFFDSKVNVGKHKKQYSLGYSNRLMRLVSDLYSEDIEFLNYQFEDQRNLLQKLFVV